MPQITKYDDPLSYNIKADIFSKTPLFCEKILQIIIFKIFCFIKLTLYFFLLGS